MIWESRYWKKELRIITSRIEKNINRTAFSDASYARFEKDLLIGFFMIRKLIDSEKISDEVVNKRIKIVKCKLHEGQVIDIGTTHKFYEKYDLRKFKKDEIELRVLCNLAIHSLVFSPVVVEGNGVSGILVNTDNTDKDLFGISLINIHSIFYNVYTDDIQSLQFVRGRMHKGKVNKGEYIKKSRGDYCEKIINYQHYEIFNEREDK